MHAAAHVRIGSWEAHVVFGISESLVVLSILGSAVLTIVAAWAKEGFLGVLFHSLFR